MDDLCAAVERGQCFGLLGVNGAGKTTTFKMLTAKVPITQGDASINGLSVRQDPRHIYQVDDHLCTLSQLQVVGYCPQFDALNGYLTGREQLAFYARIRGIKEIDVGKVYWHVLLKITSCT